MGTQETEFSQLFDFFTMLNFHEKKMSGTLSWKETYLLHYILHNRAVSISTIARDLNIPVTDTSRILSDLKCRNFLYKNIKRSDRRTVLVSITESGKSALKNSEQEFMEYLKNTTGRSVHTANESADYFELHYQHSDKLICCFKPVFDGDREISDLEYYRANSAFIREFPKIVTLENFSRLSRTMYQHFDVLISACNTVWKTGLPVKMVLDAKFPAKQYTCVWARSGQDFIIVTAELLADAAAEYLHELLPLYRYFFENKPVKMVIECASGRILEVNKAAVKFYGWTSSEFLKKTIYEISMNPPEVIRTILGEEREKNEFIFHVVHRTADGGKKKVEVHASSCLWGKNRIHYASIIADVSASLRQQAEKGTEKNADSPMKTFAARYEDTISGMSELLDYVEENGKICKYSAGDHFFEYGTLLPTFAFIIDGLFRVYYISPAGREYTLEYLRPGYFIDSLTFTECFAADEIVIENIVSGRVLVIEQNRFMRRASDDPAAFKLLYYLDKYRFCRLQQHGFSLLTRNATKRYEKFIQDESDIVSYLRGQDIASYLGITPETLSRIKKTN